MAAGEFALCKAVAVTLLSPRRRHKIAQANVPDRYYLTSLACQGILRRAAQRGKQLPEVLRLALEHQAMC
jgi:hypothetical protein